MGFLDRLFGSGDERSRPAPVPPASRGAASDLRDAEGRYAPPSAQGGDPVVSGSDEDRQAVERYRYLLRTAPPETVEQVHAEAFGKLTPSQRQQVLQDLSSGLAPSERPANDDPATLARAATRAEYAQPGFMERTFGGRSFSAGPGFGSMLGASMLGTIGGYVVGSALVGAMFEPGYDAGYADGAAADGGAGDAGAVDAGGVDPGAGADFGGDFGGDFDF
ncbi:hypothetical protein [Microbacterium sp. VKM Ac-2923]|uniref:hypothetical protein n=1 Tax=Microbacterium sp. VKM Ac-2923 TaxID=2929476 RepID=UPI001FB3882E|nr:hypothetical protein [Microbacterium sp. VKM Ac-2923]MCJ1707187.1 hypothetical protein [Microbacterium sp. VKM Ac-2923]